MRLVQPSLLQESTLTFQTTCTTAEMGLKIHQSVTQGDLFGLYSWKVLNVMPQITMKSIIVNKHLWWACTTPQTNLNIS